MDKNRPCTFEIEMRTYHLRVEKGNTTIYHEDDEIIHLVGVEEAVSFLFDKHVFQWELEGYNLDMS